MDPVTMSILSTLPTVLSEASSASSIGTAVAGASGSGSLGFLDNFLSYGKSAYNGLNDFLGTNIGSALGSMGMNTGIGAISSAMNYHYNKKLQDRAFAHQIKMYKNQNQWRVQDLRKAGLNPILATHGGSSMPSAPMGNVSTAMGQHDLSQTFLNLQGFKNQKDFRRYARESHDVNLAKSEAELYNILLQNKYVMSQIMNLDVNTSRQMYDLDFLSHADYEELRRLELLHKVFPINGEVGFNVGKGTGKGFGVNLNLGDSYNAYGRSHYYRSFGKPVGSSAYQVNKVNDSPYVRTRYKPKYHKF